MSCVLEESSAYIDFSNKNWNGRSYFLDACSHLSHFDSPQILNQYVRAGADIAEVDHDGFNCLFVFVSRASTPQNARELEALLLLLTIFDDIFATDARGNDLFVYANEIQKWPWKDYANNLRHDSSYTQDLWYCALARSGLDVR